MSQESSLSTRIDVLCSCGAVTYKLVDPTDVLAIRPVAVDVFCPSCGAQAVITLRERSQNRQSPSWAPPPVESVAASQRQPLQTGNQMQTGNQRPSRPVASGIHLTSRYSLKATELEEDTNASLG